jgi:hypothetical protein
LWVCHDQTGVDRLEAPSRDRLATMRRWSLNASRVHCVDGVAEPRILRSDHPLLRATEAVERTVRQWVNVAAVLAGSVIVRLEGGAWAAPLAVSAAGVLLILTVLVAMSEQHKRDCALELILDGDEAAPIAVVQRQRRRLLSARTRDGLAASLEDIVRYVSSPKRRMPSERPLYEPRVVAAVADELREVIGLLRTEGVCARGVCRVERLITHAGSPLYGLEVSALREELGCVRDLLKHRAM